MVEMCGGDLDHELLHRCSLEHSRGPRLVDPRRMVPRRRRCHVVRTLQLMQVALPVPVAAVPGGRHAAQLRAGSRRGRVARAEQRGLRPSPRTGRVARGRTSTSARSEPWFDPSGFLLLEIDGRLAASCWTKVHELHPDRFGEIYIISVHPDFQGRNLGRVMVTQGLDALRRKGVSDGDPLRRPVQRRRASRSTSHWASRSNATTNCCASRALVHADEAADAEGDARPRARPRAIWRSAHLNRCRCAVNQPIMPPHDTGREHAPRPIGPQDRIARSSSRSRATAG